MAGILTAPRIAILGGWALLFLAGLVGGCMKRYLLASWIALVACVAFVSGLILTFWPFTGGA